MARSKMMGAGLLPNVGGGGSLTWETYMTSLAPASWHRYRDSATPALNAGSLGSALDMTATNTTFAQTGKLGAGEAISLNGTTSLLTAANNATLAGYTTWEWVFLINPTSAGEATAAWLAGWGTGLAAEGYFMRFNAATTAIKISLFNTLGSGFVTDTNTGIATSAWSLLFFSFDNAGDRKMHVYKGVSGAVSELGYSAQPAMTGTYRAPAAALNLYNDGSTARTFSGLSDEDATFNMNLTPTQRTQLCVLAGV